MKAMRWGSDASFEPNKYQENDLVQKLEQNKGKFMWCECLSEKHLNNNTMTKLYLDRDVKRESHPYSEQEIKDDLKLCISALEKAFGDCDWAISQRHGFNPDKQMHCISWHFVNFDMFIHYMQIPLILEQKGLDDIFDTAVYKSSEQLWQLPWCHKTQSDKRVLTPYSYTKNIRCHIIQDTSNQNDSNTIKVESSHMNKKRKLSSMSSTKEVTFSKNKKVEKLQKMLAKIAKDTTSTWYKCDIQENGDESHYFKTQRVRDCFVTKGENHNSNNFVLNIRGNKVYYKCFGCKCINSASKVLGFIETQDHKMPKLEEECEWKLDTNDLLQYRKQINKLMSDWLLTSQSTAKDELSKITHSSSNCIVKLLNKYFVNILNGTSSEVIMVSYSKKDTVNKSLI